MNQNLKSIVFFGECMIEHRQQGSHFGGDTFNTAWYLKHLLQQDADNPYTIYYATATGDSEACLGFTKLMQRANIKQTFVVKHPSKVLGQYWVENNDSGERTFRFDRNNSAVRDYFALTDTLISVLLNKTIDAIYLSGISLAILSTEHRTLLINALHRFKSLGGIIWFDNNYRPVLWQQTCPKQWYLAMMSLCDIAFLTDEDEYAVFGTQQATDILTFHRQKQSHRQILVIRQGSSPCVISESQQQVEYVAAANVATNKIVDTCAAGDAFSAGFLAQYLHGASVTQAANFAHALASVVICHHGALIAPDLLPSLHTPEVTSVFN